MDAMAASEASYRFESDDGTELQVYRWAFERAARGVVHIVHGLAEHSARYAWTAHKLVSSGYKVYAHDQRGHGRTAGTPQRCGNLAKRDGWNRAVKDIARLLEAEKRENPGVPVILLGHSMGSFMVQQAMYEFPDLLDGCALSGSRGKPDFLVYFLRLMSFLERVRIGTNGRSRLLHYLSLKAANREFQPIRTNFDWLSRDPARVDEFVNDPFCGWVGPSQLWLDLSYGIIRIARPGNQKRIPAELPVYIFAGTSDPVSDGCRGLEQLIEAYGRAGMTNVLHKFYPKARHETLNEINREEVVADLLRWLGTVRVRCNSCNSQPSSDIRFT